jgi:hypothetical protein
MKRVFLSVALVLGLGLTQARGQEVSDANFKRVMGGIKVDANLSNFILGKKEDDMVSKLGFGASIGGYTKIMFGESFGLQPELLLHYKTSKREFKSLGSEKGGFQYFGIEIPIYAVLQTNMGNGKGFIGLGPYSGFGVDARYKFDGKPDEKLYGMKDVNLYTEQDGDEPEKQRWDFGAAAMLGYEFGSRLQIVGSYKIGFIDAQNVGKPSGSVLNQTFSIGLGYRF